MNVLLTGATGYVGSQLLPLLLEHGHDVRCLARDPSRIAADGARVVKGDALTGEGLDEALEGVKVAWYLIHSMAGGGDFAEQDRTAARNFASAAKRAGVRRIVYLGGLSPTGTDSAHLASRHETAELLAEGAPEFVYARAAVVIGAGSASLLMLKDLVSRLPVMICPRWIDVATQPIAATDLTRALAACGERPGLNGEVQLGGADVVSYRGMMLAAARAMDRRPPLIATVPVLSPTLSSHWVGLVTGVDPGIAKPLIDGLKTETVVMTPPPEGINDAPMGLAQAMREALAG